MAGMLRPGNAGANTASDQIAVAETALQQIPREQIETIEILLRVDSAGAATSCSHGPTRRTSAFRSAMT